MRELIVVFNGNEISVGMMLGTWLLWTAAGSSLGSRFVLGRINPRMAVAALECLLSVSLLPTVWAVRASKALFQTVPGELVGPVPMLLTSLICLSAFCILSGYLFVVATRLYAQTYAQKSAQTHGQERGVSLWVASNSAYLFEAAGSALGGILASVVLLRFLESFQIATVVALLNLCMATTLLLGAGRKRVLAVVLIGICLAVPLLIYVAPALAISSQARVWRGFHLLESRNSIYGNLAVIETGNIRSIYDNGVILANVPDEAAAEEAVHYALLEHPAPRRILLIGGGANGSVVQVLKHPTVERVDYVELDPTLIDMARQFFPAQSAPFITDPRVHIHYADGRLYLKTSRDQFDVIILDLPDPQTAQLNRFYTAEFFRSASEHLAPGGLLALQLRASEDYISPERAEFLRCIQRTLGEVFPHVLAIPGESIHFLGALRPGLLTDDPQVLIARLKARNLQTLYVREYFIPFRMMPDRMAQVRELLQPLPATPVNRDFEPIAYYFDLVLWSTQFKLGYSRWFQAAVHIAFTRIVAGVLAVLLGVAILLASVPARVRRARASAAYCMAATGFTLMALQIFLLLGFQSVYGYVYHQLAILIAMYMAGIALGSWVGIRRARFSERSPSALPSPFRVMAATQFLLALSGPALIFLIRMLSRISSGPATLVAAQFIFPALAVSGGMLGGYQFPIATEIYLGKSPKASADTGVGVLYAIDLFGGCVGALLLSTYLIPVFGFSKTAWLSAAVNLAPALLAAFLAGVTLEARTSRA
ncbi:MAG: fused MFS/spermidine synthase [Terriglobales bacterium]|jgi:spermidine synthase